MTPYGLSANATVGWGAYLQSDMLWNKLKSMTISLLEFLVVFLKNKYPPHLNTFDLQWDDYTQKRCDISNEEYAYIKHKCKYSLYCKMRESRRIPLKRFLKLQMILLYFALYIQLVVWWPHKNSNLKLTWQKTCFKEQCVLQTTNTARAK